MLFMFIVGLAIGVILGRIFPKPKKAGRLIFTSANSDEPYMLVELDNADVFRDCDRIYLDIDNRTRK